MNKLIGILLFLLSCTAASAQGTLEVTVNNISAARGKVLFALFNHEKGFPELSDKAYRLVNCDASKGTVKIIFKNIPSGTYALAVFHDVNNDGKLNTNLLGIPEEHFGFSNNARPAMRAPTFKEAAFRFKKNTRIDISI